MKYFAVIFVLSLACPGCKRDMSISTIPKGIPMTDKIKKTDAEWITLLTPSNLKSLAKKEPNALSQVLPGITKRRHLPLRLLRSSALSFHDQVRIRHRLAQLFQPIAQDNVALESDRSFSVSALKYFVLNVMPIWAMFLKMAPNPQAYATAWIPPQCASNPLHQNLNP